MHNLDLILTLTAGLAVAFALGLLSQRLHLSPIVGYLLAGVIVGPYTPGYTADKGLADQLAEVGVILLMFGVGLQFHIKELLAVRKIAVLGASVQIAVATALGAMATHLLGWSWPSGILFGLAISVASTVVLTRVLADNHALHTPTGHVAMGWLVVEDLFTVLVLVLLPALFGPEAQTTAWYVSVGFALLKLAGLLAFAYFVGQRLIPKLLEYTVRTGSRELFTLSVLVVALGIAVGSALLFGASMALGAFVAGLIVARSDFALRAASEALPMRDAFAVLFFVSIGMLFDPRFLLEQPLLVVSTLAIVLIGKPLAALAIVRVMGYSGKLALSVGVALAQIGEFSFILAVLGRQLELLPVEATGALVAAAIVSITLNPLLFRAIPRVLSYLSPGSSSAPQAARVPIDLLSAVVVGYGPVGQTVTRLLEQSGFTPVIIEMNHDTVVKLRDEGKTALYGDATREEVLLRAGIASAYALLLTAPMEQGGKDVVSIAKRHNPKLFVVARCNYVKELQALREAGVTAFSAEGESALAMTQFILSKLGATPEQLDRERERVHDLALEPAR